MSSGEQRHDESVPSVLSGCEARQISQLAKVRTTHRVSNGQANGQPAVGCLPDSKSQASDDLVHLERYSKLMLVAGTGRPFPLANRYNECVAALRKSF